MEPIDKIEDNDYFISMIELVMEEDEDIAGVIRTIVHLKQDERIRMIDEITARFKTHEVMPEIIDALNYLKANDVSEKVREITG